jgi:hypothetical protein
MFGRCAALFASGAVPSTPSDHDIHSELCLMFLHRLDCDRLFCASPLHITTLHFFYCIFSRGVNEEATLVLLVQILKLVFIYVLFLDKSALWVNPLGERFTVIMLIEILMVAQLTGLNGICK